jgi:hypothetical protein
MDDLEEMKEWIEKELRGQNEGLVDFSKYTKDKKKSIAWVEDTVEKMGYDFCGYVQWDLFRVRKKEGYKNAD